MPKQLNVNMAFTADTSQARKQLQDLQKTLDSLASNSIKNNIGKTMDADLQKAIVSARQLKDMIAEASNTKTGNLDLSKFSQEIQKSGRSIQQYAQDLSNLGPQGSQAFMQLAQSVAAAEVPMKRTFGLLDQFKVTLANAARWQISSSVLHGFMGAIQGAYGYAQDLNKSLTDIRIVTGQSTEQMAQFAEQANKSAQALSTSTLAYTDASLIYYQQGLDADEVAARTETTLKMSNVTGESAEEVSSYMTAIWNNFRKGGESLESFADKITALGAATASSSREIAGGLQQFAAIADTVGLSYDYAATALATVVAQTRQSESTVGNSFRTIFSRLEGLQMGETLEDGTDLNKYSSALATIGVNIKDQNGDLKTMDTILEEIGARWQELSRDQQVALAQTVGGVRQYSNLIALFDNWDTFQKNLSVSMGAEGTLEEQAKRYEESWQAAQKRVQAAWQAIYQDLIDDKFFIGLLDNIAKLLQGLDSIIDSIGGLKGILPAVGALLTTVFAKDLANGIETAVHNFKVFTGQAEDDANRVAVAFRDAGYELAKNLSDQGFEAQAKGLKDQIDFTLKIRENAANITEENRKWLLSLNEITKEYANAWAEAEKLKEEKFNSVGDKKLDMMQQAVASKDNTASAAQTKADFQTAQSNFLGNINDYKTQDQNLRNFIQSVNEGKVAVEDLEKGFSDLQLNQEKAVNNYQDLNSKIEAYLNVLDSENSGLISANESSEYRKVLLEEINKILGDTASQEESLAVYIAQEAKKLQESHEEWNLKAQDWIELAQLQRELEQATTEAEQAQANYNLRLKEAQIEFEQAKNKVASYADQIVSTARALSQLMAGFTALSKAWDTWTNKDLKLTPMERIQKSIPSLLTGLPMVISGFKNLTKEGTLLGGAMDKVSMIFLEGVASSGKLAGGFGAVGKAAVGLMGNLLPILGWLALAAVAVYALKKAWDAFYATTAEGKLEASNKRLEKAKEDAEKTAKAYDKLKTTLEDYEQVQEDINKMEPGADKAEAIIEENQKILEFLEENNLWDKVGKIEYDDNGLIKLTETQKEVLQNDLLREKSLARQAEYQEKINNLEAQNAVDYKKEYQGSKINIQRETEHELWSPQAGTTGKTYHTTESTDVTRDIANILNKAGLTISSNEDDIRQALLNSGDEDIVKQIDYIMPEISKIANNTELLEKFNNLQQDVVDDNAAIDAYKMQSAQAAIGQDVYNATDNAVVQQGLLEIFAELTPEMQSSIQNGIQEGGQSLAEAFKQAGVDVAEMITQAEQFEKDDLINKISSNGADNNKEEVSEWINSLSEEDLAIVAKLDIDYEDSLADIQQKLRDAPVELNISGKSSEELKELEDEFNSLTNYIKDNAGVIDELDDHLAECGREASVVARSIMRFDDAIQDVTDNYSEWSDLLKSGAWQDAAADVTEIADAYGNLLDLDPTTLGDGFVRNAENLDLMKEAIEGNEDAYNQLQQAAGESILMKIGLDASQYESDKAWIIADIESFTGQDWGKIEVGAELNNEEFLNKLTEMVNAAGMTAEQATSYLASMGVDAEVTKVPAETEPVPETHNYWIPATYSVDTKTVGGDALGVVGEAKMLKLDSPGEWSKPTSSSHEEEAAPSSFSLKVTSAHKSSGGNIKYKNASHGAGAKGAGKSGGSGGGGGGGSKKKTTKDHTKPVKNEDRYHDIKERIEDLNKSLTRLGKTEDRIYGKAKLKYMDMEIEKLEDQIKLTDEYIAEIKKYAAIDQANLRGIGMGAEFDENGMLTNYEQVLANITNSYNAAIGAYNGAVDVFNGSAQEEGDSEALDGAKKQLDAAKETYDENQKILKQYEDTFNLLQEQVDKRIDQVWALFDMRLKKITFEVEFEIDWNDRELKYLDWLLENIGDTADKGVDKIANLAQQMNEYADTIEWAKKGIQGIFGLHGINFDFDNADPVALTDQLTDAMHRLNFESQLTEDEANALLDYCDTLMEAIDGIRDKWKAAHDAVNDTWDKWNERLERETDRLENYAKEMESIKNIIDLTGRKMLNLSTQDIDKMNQSQIENNWAQVESWKAIMEARKASMEEAKYYMENAQTEEVREQWRKSYEQFEDDYNNAHQNYYSAWEDTLKKVQDAFEETMDNLGKDYNDVMGDLTLLQEQFARKQEVDHLYLDDYEKYHELNKSADELRKSLENTNSTMMKSKMNDLLDEMNASMRDGVDISEAQAEIYARRVALLQAEAELLDAQNAKSAVRMTRDNEGNFSYTYTADQDQIDDAEGNFQDKFYEVLDYERQYMEDIQGQMLDMTEQFWSDYYDLCERYKDDSAALEEAIEGLVDDYNLKMDFLVAEQEMDMGEMARLRDEDWKDFEALTGKKLANQNDFITKFKETIVGRLRPQYQNANDYATQWQKTVEKTTQEGNKAVDKYQTNTQKTFEKAGENITTYGNKAVEKMNEIAGQSQTTKDKVTEMSGQMQVDMGQVMTTAWNLDSAWAIVMNNMRTQIQQTVSALYQLLQRLQEVQRQAQATIAAVQAAAQAQAMANMGNSLGGGAGGGSGGGTGSGPGGPGRTTTGSGNSSYHSLYGGAGTADHAITDGNGGYVTGGTRGSGNTGYGVITTGNNTSMPTDVYAMLKRQGLVKASGGYTGAWGPEGVVNILHEKEFVLNKDDTANIFKVVDMVRQLDDKFGLSQGLNNLASSIVGSGSLALAGTGAMDQNVHIEANFPNVQSHTEIETALNNLVNSAAQYVNRK